MVGRIVAFVLILGSKYKIKFRICAVEMYNVFIAVISRFSKANNIKYEPFKWSSG